MLANIMIKSSYHSKDAIETLDVDFWILVWWNPYVHPLFKINEVGGNYCLFVITMHVEGNFNTLRARFTRF
jgi:hypothetical protein